MGSAGGDSTGAPEALLDFSNLPHHPSLRS